MSSHHHHHSHHTDHPESPELNTRIRREAATPEMAEKIPLVPTHHDKEKDTPPLAREESDDDLHDDRETVSHPYPGVDDGFFSENGDSHPEKPHKEDEGTETDDPLIHHNGDIPIIITSRAGGDGDSEKPEDAVDGDKPEVPTNTFSGRFPYAPSFGGRDLETGSFLPDGESSIPDVNVYQHKKTLAQGMMDLALFSANANQLRYVLESSSKHPYYYPSIVLISFSLIFQVAVGCGLIWNATYNVKNEKEICIANRINNFTVIGIFLVTVVNVFISAFGVAAAPTT